MFDSTARNGPKVLVCHCYLNSPYKWLQMIYVFA
jgi:hypothetical protein